MITVFPHTINTKSGYTAIVTNPEPGHYHFEVRTPADEPDFDWYENTYQHPKGTRYAEGGIFTQVENEILHAFWAEQRY